MSRFTLILVIILSGHYALSQCERNAMIGKSELCLPSIPGMTECYQHPDIQKVANSLKAPGTTTIGIYFTEKQYNNLYSVDQFNDYILVYTVTETIDRAFSPDMLSVVADGLIGDFVKTKWNLASSEFERRLPSLQMQRPVIVEEYKINSRIQTSIIMTPMVMNDQTTYLLIAINFLSMNDRLVCFGTYLGYEGQKSVSALKGRNDYFAMKIQRMN